MLIIKDIAKIWAKCEKENFFSIEIIFVCEVNMKILANYQVFRQL